MIKNTFDKYTYSQAVEELRIRNNNSKDPISISKNSLYYIQIIYFNPGCTISQISEMIGVSKSAVTIKISKLMKDGLVLKVGSLEDKRVHFIYCTEELIESFEKAYALRTEIYKKIEEKFSTEEINTFCKILNEVSLDILEDSNKDYKFNLRGQK